MPGAERLDEFYRIYRETADRAGFLIRTESAYRDVWDAFAPDGRARLLFAHLADGDAGGDAVPRAGRDARRRAVRRHDPGGRRQPRELPAQVGGDPQLARRRAPRATTCGALPTPGSRTSRPASAGARSTTSGRGTSCSTRSAGARTRRPSGLASAWSGCGTACGAGAGRPRRATGATPGATGDPGPAARGRRSRRLGRGRGRRAGRARPPVPGLGGAPRGGRLGAPVHGGGRREGAGARPRLADGGRRIRVRAARPGRGGDAVDGRRLGRRGRRGAGRDRVAPVRRRHGRRSRRIPRSRRTMPRTGGRSTRPGFHGIAEIQPSRHRMALPLPPGTDEAAVMDGIAKATRQRIRRAERDGVVVVRWDAACDEREGLVRATEAGDDGPSPVLRPAPRDRRPARLRVRGPRRVRALVDAGARRRPPRLPRGAGGGGGRRRPRRARPVPPWTAALDTAQRRPRRAAAGPSGRDAPAPLARDPARPRAKARTEMDLGGVDVAGARREPVEGEPTYGLYEHKRSFGARWVALAGAQERVAQAVALRARPGHGEARPDGGAGECRPMSEPHHGRGPGRRCPADRAASAAAGSSRASTRASLLRGARRRRPADRRRRPRRRPRPRAWPRTRARCATARCSSPSPGSTSTGTTTSTRAAAAGAAAAIVEHAVPGARLPQVIVRAVEAGPRAWPPAGGTTTRPRARRGRHHRHGRQDDDLVPRRGGARGRGHLDGACRDGRDEGRRRPGSATRRTSRRPAPRAPGDARGDGRQRQRRGRPRDDVARAGAGPRPGHRLRRRRSSRTSPTSTSSSTARSRRTGPPSCGCSSAADGGREPGEDRGRPAVAQGRDRQPRRPGACPGSMPPPARPAPRSSPTARTRRPTSGRPAVEEDAHRLRVGFAAPSGEAALDLRLAGRFNVHNALAVVALGRGARARSGGRPGRTRGRRRAFPGGWSGSRRASRSA